MSLPAQPFLETKFTPPFLRPNVIHRGRLLEQMALYPHTRLVLVTAPAGYGKTTLLADWRLALLEQGSAAAWIVLEEKDNQPARFLSMVCTAVQKAISGPAEATVSAAAFTSKTANSLEILAASGLKDMDASLAVLAGLLAEIKTALILILDDYHTIADSEIHYAVSYLLDHLPPNLKLAIGSRADPQLPLARLRARDELIELRLADLRFTTAEAEQFLSQTLRVPINPAELAQIEERTEGWAVGLQLIGMSLRNWPDWAQRMLQPGESQQIISSYLAEEVFHKLAPDIQQFLLKTSILDTLYAPLCDAVCGSPPAREILGWLEKENLFVIPLDPFAQRFRYHPLFAEFLQAILAGQGNGQTAELHLRASQWYQANGQSEQALYHAARAGNEPWLIHLIEQTGFYMVARSELAALHRWLSYISEGAIRQNPVLLTNRAWEQMLQGHLEQVEKDLQAAEEIMKGLSEDFCVDIAGYPFTLAALAGHITTLHAYVARIRSDWQRGIALSEQALRQLPEDEAFIRCTLEFNLAQTYKECHQLEPARRYFLEAAQLGKVSGNTYIQQISLAFLGQLAVLQGQMQAGEGWYQQGIQLGYRADGGVAVPAVGYAEAWLGDWFLLQGMLAPARQHFEQAARLAELCGEYGILHVSFLGLARACLAEGEPTSALGWVEKARGVPLDGINSSKDWIEAHFGLVLLAQGRIQEAIRWAEAIPLLMDAGQITRANEKLYLAKARVVLAGARQNKICAADQASALEMLAVLEGAARAGERTLSLVEILLLKAGLLVCSGNTGEARRTLSQAHALTDACGWAQILLDIPVEISAATGESGAGLLTERELELLRLAASGATNQEIAERLYITVGTVKSHLNHVFSKLEARHRAEAIARARELGLIETLQNL